VYRLQQLRQAGVSIWLDTVSRDLLETGDFARLVEQWSVTGATSNPTIFEKALRQSDRYDNHLRQLLASGQRDARTIFFDLALEDVGRAADILRPVYDTSGGLDGFISLQCTPDLAYDAEGTVTQALDLWARLDRPNVMIKVPATVDGLWAIEELTRHGVNVNVTLLFSVTRYEAVIDAYMSGLERRLREGQVVAGIAKYLFLEPHQELRCITTINHGQYEAERGRGPFAYRARGGRHPSSEAGDGSKQGGAVSVGQSPQNGGGCGHLKAGTQGDGQRAKGEAPVQRAAERSHWPSTGTTVGFHSGIDMGGPCALTVRSGLCHAVPPCDGSSDFSAGG
jgi:hypothetical protein